MYTSDRSKVYNYMGVKLTPRAEVPKMQRDCHPSSEWSLNGRLNAWRQGGGNFSLTSAHG